MVTWKRNAGQIYSLLAALPRSATLLLFTAVGVLFIALLTLILTTDSVAARLILDKSAQSIFPYPLTIQNLMYILFFLCLGDLFVRWVSAKRELAYQYHGFLPEDDQSVLQLKDLGPIREKVSDKYDSENGFLPNLIDLSILQLQASKSVDQAVSVLNSSLELVSHRVDLRYSFIRYVVWAIPTIGFIGTVVGISRSLALIRPGDMDMEAITGGLGIAFYTTIVALVLSAVLVFLLHAVQKNEETAVNIAGDYTLRNLINRLFVSTS